MRALIVFTLVALIFVSPSRAQQTPIDELKEYSNARIIIDSTARKAKVRKKKRRKTIDLSRPMPDPKKAALYAAVLPGLGQAYNRKYWKIPIVYGAAIGLAIAIDYNHGLYIDLRRALFAEIDGDPETVVEAKYSRLNEQTLRNFTDRFRNDRDQLIILGGVLYALTIIEAHVDAHLREFKVNKDLAFKIKPSVSNSFAGVTFALKIK